MHGLYKHKLPEGDLTGQRLCDVCGCAVVPHGEAVCPTCTSILADMNLNTQDFADSVEASLDDIDDYLATFVCGQHFACALCEDTVRENRAGCPYVRIYYGLDVDVTGP